MSASRVHKRVTLDPRSYEQRLWDEYSLALIFPRFLPEWMPDETISARLHELKEEERLPEHLDRVTLAIAFADRHFAMSKHGLTFFFSHASSTEPILRTMS